MTALISFIQWAEGVGAFLQGTEADGNFVCACAYGTVNLEIPTPSCEKLGKEGLGLLNPYLTSVCHHLAPIRLHSSKFAEHC